MMTCRHYNQDSWSVDPIGVVRGTHSATAPEPGETGFPGAADAGREEHLLAAAAGGVSATQHWEEVRQP